MTKAMFMYWGRRGAISQLALQTGQAARRIRGLYSTISVSRQNEKFEAFYQFGDDLFAIDTFSSAAGAMTGAWRIPRLRRQVSDRLRREGTDICFDLMPHVWSPFIAPVIRRAGVRYAPIVHDSEPHRGDPTGAANAFALRVIPQSDFIVCLSSSVSERLVASGRAVADRVVTLFHPDYDFGVAQQRTPPANGAPWRLLFLGRIMAYKGLDLFIDAVEHLRRRGHAVEVGVLGEGPLGANAARLQSLGAEVVNRWLDESEIAEALSRYHITVLSHTNASQSGVVAAAHGAAMPIVATPVGGLKDQIADGETGVLAARADAVSLTDAIERLISNPQLYSHIHRTIRDQRAGRSADAFVMALLALAKR